LLKWMPESPRWLEIKGHTREADAIVSKLEHDIERRTGGHLPPPQIADIEAKSDTGNPACHPECSEGSVSLGTEMLRCAQHDRVDGGANKSTRQKGRYIQILERPYLKRTVMMWVAFSCILFIF